MKALTPREFDRRGRGWRIAQRALRSRGSSDDIRVNDDLDSVSVPSQFSRPTRYNVRFADSTCECLDYVDWESHCKHMWATSFYLKTLLPSSLEESMLRALTLDVAYWSGSSDVDTVINTWLVLSDLLEESAVRESEKVCSLLKRFADSRAKLIEGNPGPESPKLLPIYIQHIWIPNDRDSDSVST